MIYGMKCMYAHYHLTNRGNWGLLIDFTFSNGTKSFSYAL